MFDVKNVYFCKYLAYDGDVNDDSDDNGRENDG